MFWHGFKKHQSAPKVYSENEKIVLTKKRVVVFFFFFQVGMTANGSANKQS